MTYLSLFSGCGGGDLGFERAGLRCVGQVEADPFRRRILAWHWPDVPRWDDIRTFDPIALGWERPDVILFGSPCQDLSTAGLRAGLRGERSGLFCEAIRVIRAASPAIAVWENVPGALSSAEGNDFAAVIDGLADCGALDIVWRVLDSRYWGVAQRRRRVWLVADFTGERASQVLLDSTGGARHPASGRPAQQGIAPRPEGGAGRVGMDDGITSPTLTANNGGHYTDGVNDPLAVSGTLTTSPHGDWRYDPDETFVAPTLRTEPYTNSNGGTEAQALVFVKSGRARSASDGETWRRGRVSPTLTPFDTGDVRSTALVAHALTSSGHDGSEDGTGRGSPLVVDPGRRVRRLTPQEWERLQGMPDGWTAVDGPRTPDSPRYAAIGDAMSVPVAEWIGRRLSNYAGAS